MMTDKKIYFLILLFLNYSLFSQEREISDPVIVEKLKPNYVYAGYSALLPGLGQVKKDRLFTGIFFFSVFGASLYNYKVNLEKFREEEKRYAQSSVGLNFLNLYSTTSLVSGNNSQNYLFSSVLASKSFARYDEAGRNANQAVLYIVAIYLIQIGHAFFCSPGSSFEKPLEAKTLESSNFNFSIYPNRNQFGQIGTNLDINYTWRF